MTLDQEDTEEAIGSSLKGEAHKNDLLSEIYHLVRCLKATSASLWGRGS